MSEGIPRISVVMGVYNGAEHLAETVESVLAQRAPAFEFISVDDGSTDATPRLLAAVEQANPCVRVLHQENAGLTRALMAGCAAARGEYIARVDVGDAMTPDRLRLQCDLLDRCRDISFASCWTEFCGPGWEFLYVDKGAGVPPDGMDVLPDTDGGNLRAGPTCHPSVMMRREDYQAAGGYRPQFYYGQDWDLWYRLAERGRFGMVPRVLYRVRLFPDSISGRNRERQAAIGRCSLEAFTHRRRGEPEEAALARASAIRPDGAAAPSPAGAGAYLIGEMLRRNGDGRARAYLWRAVRSAPLNPRHWLRLLQSLPLRRKGGA